MTVYGALIATKFAAKHAEVRRPISRLLTMLQAGDWRTFVALKQSPPTVDQGRRTGKLIFDICGNRYRLIAAVNFEQQEILIESVLTHKEYDRENL